MDFNKEVSYAYYIESIGVPEIPPIGYNCGNETFHKLQAFLETDFEKIEIYEKEQSNLYQKGYKTLDDISIIEFLLVKWNKLWLKKQITT